MDVDPLKKTSRKALTAFHDHAGDCIRCRINFLRLQPGAGCMAGQGLYVKMTDAWSKYAQAKTYLKPV